MWRGFAVVVALLLAGPALAEPTLAQASAAVAAHGDGFSLDADPQAPALLAQQWTLLEAAALAFLKAHPQATPRQLEHHLQGLPGKMQAQVLALDHDTLLVALQHGEIGTVFGLAREQGVFAPRWHIGDAPELAGWRPENARAACREDQHALCGPLHANLGRLPPEADGSPRFYVDATYAQAMGATVAAQLSFWRWHAGTAQLRRVENYAYMIDQRNPAGAELRGHIVHVGAKAEFKSFFSCGGCEGRQVDWQFRLRPDGMDDLGQHGLMPELDRVDELFYRLLKHQPADDLAAAAVIAKLTPLLNDVLAQSAGDDRQPLGMLMDWSLRRRGSQRLLRLALDADELGPFEFTLDAGGRVVGLRDWHGER